MAVASAYVVGVLVGAEAEAEAVAAAESRRPRRDSKEEKADDACVAEGLSSREGLVVVGCLVVVSVVAALVVASLLLEESRMPRF
jgi:hypothetical protein